MSGFTSNGTNLDDIFQPRTAGIGTNRNFKTNSVDLNNRFKPITYGYRIDGNTNFTANGVDLAETFAAYMNRGLWVWGRGRFQGYSTTLYVPPLGLNGTTSVSSPTQVGSLIDWVSVQGSPTQTLATKGDGTLWAWGYGGTGLNRGGIGNGTTLTYSSPIQIGAITQWYNINTGQRCGRAIQEDFTLWTWGTAFAGQLGLNDAISRSSPTQIGSLTNWNQVTGRFVNAGAVKRDGTLWTWGRADLAAYKANLGLNLATPGANHHYSSPTQVGSLTNWQQLVMGNSSYAVKTDGTLWAWGANASFGSLGLNNSQNRSSPTQVGILTNWASVNGHRNLAAVKYDGTLWVSGEGAGGRLGLNESATNRSSPTQVGTLTNWTTRMDLSQMQGAAVKTDGTLWAWGYDGNVPQGAAGQNDVLRRSSPTQVGLLTSWKSVSTVSVNTSTVNLQGSAVLARRA